MSSLYLIKPLSPMTSPARKGISNSSIPFQVCHLTIIFPIIALSFILMLKSRKPAHFFM
ncbi:hypothetical protein AOQ84DRAFT_35708 [Glonium stellatum]|uniref:Uncharacterized protein n=1 Tax=Glonium stellatum TaxID=574774 RepID=A0A8E2JYQ9_9PEZI|nr:hypothetical protein AOQ84DRAFT_35708 [Glonium stellatum]